MTEKDADRGVTWEATDEMVAQWLSRAPREARPSMRDGIVRLIVRDRGKFAAGLRASKESTPKSPREWLDIMAERTALDERSTEAYDILADLLTPIEKPLSESGAGP